MKRRYPISLFENRVNVLHKRGYTKGKESDILKQMEEAYDRKLLQLQTRRKEITALQIEHQEGNEEFKIALTTLVSLASKAPEIFKSSKTEVKRSLIGFVFSNLEMNGGSLCYSLREPFCGFQNTAAYHEWLWQGLFENPSIAFALF